MESGLIHSVYYW